MKKIMIVVLALMLLAAAGCSGGKETASEPVSTGTGTEAEPKDAGAEPDALAEVRKLLEGVSYESCEDVLADIETDVAKSLEELETRYNALTPAFDGTYESYEAHADELYDWFDFAQKEAEQVYSMMTERSKVYFLLLAVTVGPDNVFSPKDRMMELHMPVYTAFDDVWMSIYMKHSEIWNKLYPVLSAHGDELKRLENARNPFYEAVKGYKETYYKEYQDTYDKVYKTFKNGEADISGCFR